MTSQLLPTPRLAAITLALVLAALTVACGNDDDATETPNSAADPTSTVPASPGATATTSAEAAFPVTIQHKFGEAVVEADPERVVTVGFSEQDPALALGVVPVAVREWFGKQPNAVWPWAQDELDGGAPEVMEMPFGELDYEQIAGLDPDLILATHSGITGDEYDRLSAIAPTVAQSGDYPDFGMPWQEQTRLIGQALGRADRAEALVSDVESAIDATHEENPAFDDLTIAWLSPTGDGQYVVTGPTTPPMRFLDAIGLGMPEALASEIGDLSSLQLSAEQIGLVEADVLILQTSTDEERDSFVSDPVFSQLPAVQGDRLLDFVGLDDPLYGALSFSTVLSLQYALEELAPRLASFASQVD